jgi:hypothetical protein
MSNLYGKLSPDQATFLNSASATSRGQNVESIVSFVVECRQEVEQREDGKKPSRNEQPCVCRLKACLVALEVHRWPTPLSADSVEPKEQSVEPKQRTGAASDGAVVD